MFNHAGVRATVGGIGQKCQSGQLIYEGVAIINILLSEHKLNDAEPENKAIISRAGKDLNSTYHRGTEIDELVTRFSIVADDLNDKEQAKVFYHSLSKDLAAPLLLKFILS